MEKLDPEYLDELLEVLQERGVAEFSCPLFSVSMTQVVVREAGADTDIARAIARKQEAKAAPVQGQYGNPSLWARGRPPEFPRNDRAVHSAGVTDDE